MTLNLQPEELTAVIDEVLDGFSEKLSQQQVSVEKKYLLQGRRQTMDRDLMAEAISRLINNCLEAMPDGGCILLRVAAGEDGKKAVLLEISDTGGGIPRENMEEIFSPFFSTRLRGLGLGLPIAKKIIQAHKGSLEILSEAGSGTTYRIVLPDSLQLEGGIQARIYPEIVR